jgi:hypothetical protein
MRLHLPRRTADHLHTEEGEPQPFFLARADVRGSRSLARRLFFLPFSRCTARLSTPSTESTGIRLLEQDGRYSRCGQPSPPVTPSPRGRKGRAGRACRAACGPGLYAAPRCRVRAAPYLFNAADPPPCDWFGYISHAQASATASVRVELLLAFLMISSRIASCACSLCSCRRRAQSPPFLPLAYACSPRDSIIARRKYADIARGRCKKSSRCCLRVSRRASVRPRTLLAQCCCLKPPSTVLNPK